MNFHTTQWLLYATGAFIFFADLYRSRLKDLRSFAWEQRFYFISSFIWLLMTWNVQFAEWDEFSWGLFAKHINQFGTYWRSSSAIVEIGASYLPGLSLWENFFIGKGFYFEQPLFFSLGLLLISCLHVMIPRGLGFKKFLGLLLLSLYSLFLFSSGASTIYVDPSMGFVMALILMALYETSRSQSHHGLPLIIILFFALTKETGFLLSLLYFFIIFLQLYRTRELNRKKGLLWVGALLMVLFNYFIWQQRLKGDPHILVFNTHGVLPAIQADVHQMSSKTNKILNLFGEKIFTEPLARGVTGVSFLAALILNGSYVFWVLLFSVLLFSLRKYYEYFWGFILGLVGYTAVLLLTWLYLFIDSEGLKLASYDRYLGVYFSAFAIFLGQLLWQEDFFKRKRSWVFVATLFLLVSPPFSLLPACWQHHQFEGERGKIKPFIEKIKSQVPDSSAVWLIWQNSDGLQALMAAYELAPRKVNSWNWSLGEKYGAQDFWTSDFSASEFTKFASSYDYLAMGFVDESFVKKYGIFFATEPRSGQIYKKSNKTPLQFSLFAAP